MPERPRFSIVFRYVWPFFFEVEAKKEAHALFLGFMV